MKKLLIASTALSLAGGAAFAEMAITVSGDAKMGVDYASEPVADPVTGAVKSKHSFVHEIGIDFGASGTTDGGLTFGASAGFDVSDKAINTGTVNVSGSFGTLTIGGNDAADLTAGGTADVGLNDIGVDGMAEGLRGTTAAQLRYDNSFGQIKIAISAGTKAGKAAVAAVPASQWMITDHEGHTRVYPVSYTRDMDGNVELMGMPLFGPGTPATDDDADTGVSNNGVATGDGVYVPTAFDMAFRVIRRVDSTADTPDAADQVVLVDHDGDGSPTDVAATTTTPGRTAPVNIYGMSLGADGKIYEQDGGDAGDDPDLVVENDANAARIAAFRIYMKGHELGGDKMVGGVGKTGDKDNADKAKEGVVTDNEVAAVPAVASDTEYAFGMSFNAGGVTIGVGYDSNKTVSMGAGFSAGEITTKLLFVKTEDERARHQGGRGEVRYGRGHVVLHGCIEGHLGLWSSTSRRVGEAMDAVGMGVTHRSWRRRHHECRLRQG